MRFVYSHFPINVTVTNKDSKVEIRNFLGEKVVRVVDAIGDTKVKRSADVKDEIVLEGSDIQSVSRTAALIQQVRRSRRFIAQRTTALHSHACSRACICIPAHL